MMGRKWQGEWQHTHEELFQAYHGAVDPRLRTRLQALWLLRGGRTLEEAANLTAIVLFVKNWRQMCCENRPSSESDEPASRSRS